MAEILLQEGEVLEDLQLAGMKILQKIQGFRYGMDAVLLADFVRMGTRDRAADFGTGTGILPLLLLGRGKGAHFDALEIQQDMAEMAQRTVRINGLEARMQVHLADVQDAHTILGYEKMDAVVCNPPYGTPGSSLKNPDASRAIARHQTKDGILPWLQAASRVLRVRGRFSMIYPAARMLEVMETMDALHLTPKRFRLVYPGPDKPANLVLIEAQKHAKPLLHTEPPLIIRDADGKESSEICRIYHMEPGT